MSVLREKFDIRPMTKGVMSHGQKQVVSNQIGYHVYHVGEVVDLHYHDSVIHVKILGKANEHLIGEIDSFNEDGNTFENMKAGQKITFDEYHIFDCYDN
ncbi:MAG: hypothetical protein MK132_26640 [Lentisphaerales bacterium]|nr:hypothetical protein [Lentisphaerales bacterium]